MPKNMYQKRAERKQNKVNNTEVENKTNINWYPGHMAKAKNDIKKIIKQIDIVLEIVDARVPYSSKVKDIKEFTNNKDSIIVFSKYDLCDKTETDKWKSFYEKEGYSVVCTSLNNSNSINNLVNVIGKRMEKINDKRKEKGLLPKKAKVLVVGVPNVGKSTLINSVAGKKKVIVENRPGVTKSLSWIKVNDKIDLMDSPGILVPKLENEEVALNLASMSIIKETVLPIEKVSLHILDKLNFMYKDKLKSYYNLDNYDINNIMEVYETISKFRNINKINNEVDYDRINLLILNDIKNERIKDITFDKI